MNTSSLDQLNLKIEYQVLLSFFTTFQLGGPCKKGIIHCQTPEQLESAVKFLINQKEKFILIGGGSNLVVSDGGLDCFVIRYVSEKPLITLDGDHIIVSASTILDHLALFAAEHGLEGLNYTSGIPGTVGGAIVGNAGAFGQQVGDVLETIEVITPDGERKKQKADELRFTYRDSFLKKTGNIVLSARFKMVTADKDKLLKEREEILNVRREKHPNLTTHPCAGSFFRNIEPTSKAGKRQAAGWFLEQAGGKSLSYGGAKIFEKHANIIVKTPGCKAQDVFELSLLMQKLVKEKFNLDLVREVRFVGQFSKMPKQNPNGIW